MTFVPRAMLGISLSNSDSASVDIVSAILSICSTLICLLRQAISKLFNILSRLNSSLRPSLFTTCKRALKASSYVVNLSPHISHSRRLLIEPSPLPSRLSMTFEYCSFIFAHFFFN